MLNNTENRNKMTFNFHDAIDFYVKCNVGLNFFVSSVDSEIDPPKNVQRLIECVMP
ncbi:MAG: hypothetical protein MHPSP_002630, partial [Paramarteilia canceri]